MTIVTGDPMLSAAGGYCVPVSKTSAAEGRAALAELAARQELAEAQREAERRIAADQPYEDGVDRDEFRSRYGV